MERDLVCPEVLIPPSMSSWGPTYTCIFRATGDARNMRGGGSPRLPQALHWSNEAGWLSAGPGSDCLSNAVRTSFGAVDIISDAGFGSVRMGICISVLYL